MCIVSPGSVEFQLFVLQIDKSMYCATLFAVNEDFPSKLQKEIKTELIIEFGVHPLCMKF